MIPGILGKKIGMTQIFDDEGSLIPVTAVETGPCVVTQVKKEANDGYNAIQLGFLTVKKVNKPKLGHLKGNGLFKKLIEFKDTEESLNDIKIGDNIDVSNCKDWKTVNVVGRSKGKGFQGAMKRHGFQGQQKTHGQSDRLRAPGSIGGTTYPGRVYKGKKMAGHMGFDQVTIKKMKIINCDEEKGHIFIKGSLPGATGDMLILRKDS